MDILCSVLLVAALVIALIAFLFGAVKLFRAGIPTFCKMAVCAAGCYTMEEICALVYAFCGNITYNGFHVSTLGTFGCLCFLLTAAYAGLEPAVDRTSPAAKRAGRVALLAPALLILFFAVFLIGNLTTGYLSTVIYNILLSLPVFFGAYYTLKHLLLERDALFDTFRLCNALILAFYLLNLVFLIVYFFSTALVIAIVSVVLAANVAAIVLTTVKGAKQWKA